VIAAHGVLSWLPIVVRWANSDRDARQAGNGLDNANELRRPKGAAELIEARRKIRDPDRGAVPIAHDGGDDRRIASVL
jgi:hypothetical protein